MCARPSCIYSAGPHSPILALLFQEAADRVLAFLVEAFAIAGHDAHQPIDARRTDPTPAVDVGFVLISGAVKAAWRCLALIVLAHRAQAITALQAPQIITAFGTDRAAAIDVGFILVLDAVIAAWSRLTDVVLAQSSHAVAGEEARFPITAFAAV